MRNESLLMIVHFEIWRPPTLSRLDCLVPYISFNIEPNSLKPIEKITLTEDRSLWARRALSYHKSW